MKSKRVYSLTLLVSACLLFGSSLVGFLSIFGAITQPAFADDFECNDTSIGVDTNEAHKTNTQKNIDSHSETGSQTTVVSTGTGDSAGTTGSGNATTLTDKSNQQTEIRTSSRVVRGQNCDNANNNRRRMQEQKVRADEDRKRVDSMNDFFKDF
jgi:hypothetical protein